MNSISVLKLRKIPINQRLDLIECLSPTECHNECLFLLHLLSGENYIREDLVIKTLKILFGKHVNHIFDAYDILNIITFKCVDLLYFIKEIYIPYVSYHDHFNCDMLIATIDKIIISKLSHTNIKEIVILLEDLFIIKDKNNENTIQSTCYLLENVILINKLKILNHLMSKKDSNYIIKYLSSVKFKYPENSILRNKIENIINIHDIII